MEVTEEDEEEGSASVAENQMMFGDICDKLSILLQKIKDFFPVLEEFRPQKSGMQALCELHVAADKAGNFLHQIMNSSKIYLLITSESVTIKFKKVKETLKQTLKCLELNVPDDLVKEVALFFTELESIKVKLSASHHDSSIKMMSLLQREKQYPCLGAETEDNVFDEIAFDLGFTSMQIIQNEKKALKRLLNKVRDEQDKKKELIVLYLLHLLRKFERSQKQSYLTKVGSFQDTSSSTFSQSLSERGSEATSTSGRDSDLSSELSYYETLKLKNMGFVHPPEEFRCPISLQLMSDPVIISSGQTYERICIEKWFEEGHDTCPKTQQTLAHLQITPNYCVKGLIVSWCERQSIPLPIPPSLPLQSKCFSVKNMENRYLEHEDKPSDLRQGVEGEKLHQCIPNLDINAYVDDLPDRIIVKDDTKNKVELVMNRLCTSSLDIQCSAAREIRYLTKDDEGARALFGHLGCIPPLVGILRNAMKALDENAVIMTCLALSNITVNNDRNREELVRAGVVPLLLNLLQGSCLSLSSKEVAILVLWSISCLQENKLQNCLSKAVQLLVEHLDNGSTQGIKDALSTLLNLSSFHGNQICIAKANVVPKVIHLLSIDEEICAGKCKDTELIAKGLAILYRLCSIEEGRNGIMESENGISCLVDMLDTGTQMEKEQVAAIFLVISSYSSHHSQIILEEGIIPSLVMISVNGTERGKTKAQKLLQHFRQQRQKESTWHSAPQVSSLPLSNTLSSVGNDGKCISGKKTGRTSFASVWRSKSLSFYRC